MYEDGYMFVGEFQVGVMMEGTVYESSGAARFTMKAGEFTESKDDGLVQKYPLQEETLSRTDGLDDIKAQPRMRRKVSKAFDVLPSLCLTLVACALKMVAYWCQLQANEFVYSAQLSAVRKSGMLLVLLLGRFLFNEDVASKWLPVSTMLVGVGLLAAI